MVSDCLLPAYKIYFVIHSIFYHWVTVFLVNKRLIMEVKVSSLNLFPHPLQVSQNFVFVVKHWGPETNKLCEDYEYCSENCISRLHLSLNISMKFNEIFIDAFVVFCRLRGPKLLLAGGRSEKKWRQSLQLGVNLVAASRKELCR